MRYLNEQEAWYMIAAMIEGTDMLDKKHGHRPAGLCSLVMRMRDAGAISNTVSNRMVDRGISAAKKRTNNKDVYLTRPCNWTNGIRLEYALKFAEECAPKSKQ